jgi:hypothetical protein
MLAEQGLPQLGFRRLRRFGLVLVLREFPDEFEDQRQILRRSGFDGDAGVHPNRLRCLSPQLASFCLRNE